MVLFDAYVMVDWSAAAAPRRGADSIWISLWERGPDGAAERDLVNPPTRAAAADWLADRLSDLAARGATTLLGFDFNFGFPKGFAGRLSGGAGDWRTLWRRLSRLVDDGDDNGNRRFALAGRLNGELSGRAFPFWGCPAAEAGPTLLQTKPDGFGADLPEFRLTESRLNGVQPVWKLYAPGAVGSQTLLGIPRVLGLREHPWLKDHLRLWPFETGLAPMTRPASGTIVAAEIYPSLIPPDPAPVKDAGQVRAMARHCASLDDARGLGDLFAGDPTLTPDERETVETQEGWILGVTGTLKPSPLMGEGLGGGDAAAKSKIGDMPCPAGETGSDHPIACSGRASPPPNPPPSRGRAIEGIDVIRDPAEIYRQSFAIIRREADLSRLSGPMEALAVRIVHACGMPDVAAELAFSDGAARAGCRALKAGRPILVDARMADHGIIRSRLPAANPVLCLLDDPRVPALAESLATTRSAAAVRLWRDHLEDAVVAIGNAPTALFELLAMVAEGAPRPALVLGFPVGFVGAAESKQALIGSRLAFVTLPGRRGGSAMAAAAVNALAGEAR